jgi:hypothetical protein
MRPELKVIRDRADLVKLRDMLGVGSQWHEPDQVGVSALTGGKSFDNANASCLPAESPELMYTDAEEMYVIVRQDGYPVACVNLAMLFAWATGYADD